MCRIHDNGDLPGRMVLDDPRADLKIIKITPETKARALKWLTDVLPNRVNSDAKVIIGVPVYRGKGVR